MIVPDYDAENSPPSSEQIASSYEDVAEDSPWKDITCVLKPNAMDTVGPRHFVRTGAVPSGTDVKLYDVANVFFASVGGSSAAIGKIYAEYDITFHTPATLSTGTPGSSGTIEGDSKSATTILPFGANPTFANNGVGLKLNAAPNGYQVVLTPDSPNTEYLFILTGTAGTPLSASLVGSGTYVSNNVLFADVGGAGDDFAVVETFNVGDTGNGWVAVTLTATSITNCQLQVFTLPQGYQF